MSMRKMGISCPGGVRLHEKTCIVQETMEYRFEKSRSVHVERMWCHSNCTAQDGEPLSYFGSRHMKRLQLSASRDVDRLFPLVTHTVLKPRNPPICTTASEPARPTSLPA